MGELLCLYQTMRFYILFFCSVLLKRGSQECLGGRQSSRPDPPTEWCRLTWKKLPLSEKLQNCFFPLYEAGAELTESENRIHSQMQREIQHGHLLARGKSTTGKQEEN